MLTVYGRKSSFNLQKVMWLVDELGISHLHVELGGSFGGLDDPAFLAKNPHGRVPVIDDDGHVVWESHAILRYLAARYGTDAIWSPDPARQSIADQWMDWSQTALQPAFLNGIFWGYYRTPEAQRDMAAVNANIEKTAGYLAILDRQLEGRSYLLGDRLTLADIPPATCLYRYYNLDIPRPALPNVERWYDTLQQRAAYRKHVMLSFDELFGRLAY